MKKLILVAPLIALFLYCGYGLLTLHRFTDAVAATDADTLSDLIDFPSLRASLKEQFTSALMTRAYQNYNAKDSGAVIGMGLVTAFGPAMINNMVDGLVSPSGIAKIITKKLDTSAHDNSHFSRALNNLSVVSPTSFKLISKPATLVFHFEDWTWKLTDVRIPSGTLDSLTSQGSGQQQADASVATASLSPPRLVGSTPNTTDIEPPANGQTTLFAPNDESSLASLDYDGKDPVQVKYSNLVIKVDREATSEKSSWLPTVDAMNERGDRLFSIRLVGDESEGQENPAAQVRIVKLDPNSQTPQVLFLYSTFGAHCCVVNQIATAGSDGIWHVIDAGSLDGDGYEFRDLDRDDGKELVAKDNSFLYVFGCYACSYQPTRIKKLVGSELKDVTTDLKYRSFLRDQLQKLELSARKYGNDKTLTSPGYLAAWVAAKSLVGEFSNAWSVMLGSYREDPDWPLEECSASLPVYQCPSSEKHRVDFPHALANHLLQQGYITAVQREQLNLSPTSISPQAAESSDSQTQAPQDIAAPSSATAVSPNSGIPDQPSFDCALKLTPIEQAICSDSELKQWDSRMGRDFKSKFIQLVPGERRILLKSQRQWIALRKKQCFVGDQNSLKQCILNLTKARVAVLTASSRSEAVDIPDKSYLSSIFPLIMAQRRFPTAIHPAATSVIAFWLDDLGNVSREELYNTSGYRELDSDALAAVMRAGPFPMVPPGQPHGFIAKMSYPSTLQAPYPTQGYGASQN